MHTPLIDEIFVELENSGARIGLREGSIHLSVPKGSKLAPQLLEKVRLHKEALIARLHEEPGADRPGIYPVMHNQWKEFIRYRIVGPFGFNLLLRLPFSVFDPVLIEKVIRTIFERHESLRTHFRQCGKEIMQVIERYPMEGFQVEYLDWRMQSEKDTLLRCLLDSLPKLPMDFEKGPLADVRIVRLEDEFNLLLLTMHHVICDELSLEILRREITALYESFIQDGEDPLPPARTQYRDYTGWVRSYLAGEKGQRSHQYYLDQLVASMRREEATTGQPIAATEATSYRAQLQKELQRYLQRDDVEDLLQNASGFIVNIYMHPGAVYTGFIHGPELLQLRKLAVSGKTTVFSVLLTLLSISLHRVTGKTEIRYHIPYNARTSEALESVVGWLVGHVILCLPVNHGSSLDSLLPIVEESFEEAARHCIYPYEKLLEQLDLTLDVLSLINLNFIKEGKPLKDFTPRHEPDAQSHFDLFIAISEYENAIRIRVNYKLSRFRQDEIEAVIQSLSAQLSCQG